jgi:hypothetical protein
MKTWTIAATLTLTACVTAAGTPASPAAHAAAAARPTALTAGPTAGAGVNRGVATAHTARITPKVKASPIHYSVRTAEVHGCYAALDSELSGGVWYVRARFFAHTVSCFSSALYQRKGSGSYKRISYIYHETPGYGFTYTGWHRDPSPYKAKACTSSDTFVRKCTAAF